MARRPLGAALALLMLIAIVPACGKSVGSSCKQGESACLNAKSALSCVGGKFVEVTCKGPLGCSRYQDQPHCDVSVASEGDNCLGQNDEEYACSTDKKRALICKNGKMERYLECRGKSGCALLGQQVSCDTSVAEKNDPCKVQGASACTPTQKELLVCKDGKFVHYRHCRGQAGCYTRDDAPACDETMSIEGDECGLPGFVVCSVDAQSELICQNGQFIKARTCRNGCTVIGGGRGGINCK